MRFGPHTQLVEEVIDYARNGELFVGAYRGDKNVVLIETDFSKAQERAWTQDPDNDDMIWSDLRGLLMSKVRGQRSKLANPEIGSKELPKLGDELNAIFKKRLSQTAYDAIMDEVASDFYHCAYKRAVLGNEPHFFETLYESYRAGGWPCGWKGEYPAGMLVLYLPSS